MKYEVRFVTEIEADSYSSAAINALQLLENNGITRFTVTPVDYYRDGRSRHRMSKAKLVDVATGGLTRGV